MTQLQKKKRKKKEKNYMVDGDGLHLFGDDDGAIFRSEINLRIVVFRICDESVCHIALARRSNASVVHG